MSTRKKEPAPEGATVENWRGYKRYACTECQFDTLDPGKFADHYRNVHGSLETHEIAPPAYELAPPPVGETTVEG